MMTQNKPRPIDILVVEDNPGDVMLIEDAFAEGKGVKSLSIARDGAEAMEFLYRQGEYANAIKPDLILLDLNLPKMDGHEVLQEIKSHPELRRIPAIIFTSSQAERDIIKAYDSNANGYLIKPVDGTQFLEVIRSIEDFWAGRVLLPPKE